MSVSPSRQAIGILTSATLCLGGFEGSLQKGLGEDSLHNLGGGLHLVLSRAKNVRLRGCEPCDGVDFSIQRNDCQHGVNQCAETRPARSVCHAGKLDEPDRRQTRVVRGRLRCFTHCVTICAATDGFDPAAVAASRRARQRWYFTKTGFDNLGTDVFDISSERLMPRGVSASSFSSRGSHQTTP